MSQTLERGLRILEFVAERPRQVGEIAEFLNVHHSTALRLLQTLHAQRFVKREDNGRYRLGSALFGLGHRALEDVDLRRVTAPYMRELNDRTGETVHLAVLEGRDVVYVEKVESRHPVRMYSRIGIVAPLHCTGVAKAILAFQPAATREAICHEIELPRHTDHTLTTADELLDELETTRRRGYAVDNEEHELGIHCIAAPIRSADGSVRSGMSVSVPTSRLDREALLAHVPDLLALSGKVSEELGWRSGDRGPAY